MTTSSADQPSLYRLTATADSPSSAASRGTATITESIEQSDSDDAALALLDLLRSVT